MATARLAVAAPAADAAQVDRFTDALVEVLPIGRMLEAAAADNPRWPLHEKPDLVDPARLACMRREFSADGWRRAKERAAVAYVASHPARIDDDVRILRLSAPVFARMASQTMAAERVDATPDAAAALQDAQPDQLQALSELMADPRYAPLREVVGIGDAYRPGRTPEQNGRAGESIGAALVSGLFQDALKACDIPPAALFE